jgi:short-subunit dehydrogenase
MPTWLISGASSGLGYAVTRQLLAKGEQVIACARRLQPLHDLAHTYSGQLRIMALNVDDYSNIQQVVSEAFSPAGPIDVVLSSAGYGLFGAVEELSRTQIEAQLRTNLLGSIFLIQACLPYLRAQGRGHILQMSSESGEMSFPALAMYQASKWGIEGFCEGLRQEVECLGLHVTLVVPGRVATGFDGNVVKQQQTLPAYQGSTVGNYRRLLAMGKFPSPGCVEKMASAIIACADQPQPPRRIFLGSDAYKNIHRALNKRLQELESQLQSAALTDRTAPLPP